MNHPVFTAELARLHRCDLVRQAERYRRSRGKSHPSGSERTVTACDDRGRDGFRLGRLLGRAA